MGNSRRGMTADARTAELAAADFRCAACGPHSKRRPPERLEIDHIIELADGGDDTQENKQVLCLKHHALKTAKSAKARVKPSTGWARKPIGVGFIAAAVLSAFGHPAEAVAVLLGTAGLVGVVVALRHSAWVRRETIRADRIANRARQRPDQVAAVPVPVAPVLSPMEAALTGLCRGPVIVNTYPDDNRMAVYYPATFRDDSDQARADFLDVVQAKTSTRWRPRWDTGANRVDLLKRPDMPTRIDRPTNPGSLTAVPFAVDEDHEVVVWRTDLVPHMLIAGATSSGKSNLIRGVARTCIEAGWDVRPCDPKRIELIGLRDLVDEVATTEERMAAMVERTHDEMMFRYAALEVGDTTEAQLQPILLVVDEAMVFVQQMDEWWRDNKKPGMTGTSHPVVRKWQKIAVLGRSARVLLLTGMQRPDAALLGDKAGGATRDQYGVRIALGPMSPDGSRMMFNRADVGRDIPQEIRGRATAAVGDGDPREVQCWYAP